MSEKLPRIPADKAVKVLEKVGFVCVRQSGSRASLYPMFTYTSHFLYPRPLYAILNPA